MFALSNDVKAIDLCCWNATLAGVSPSPLVHVLAAGCWLLVAGDPSSNGAPKGLAPDLDIPTNNVANTGKALLC